MVYYIPGKTNFEIIASKMFFVKKYILTITYYVLLSTYIVLGLITLTGQIFFYIFTGAGEEVSNQSGALFPAM